MSLGIAIMSVIIVLTFATVVAVIYFGAKENVDAHGVSADESPSVAFWRTRAETSAAARSHAGQAAAATAAEDSSAASEEDEKEARRKAALERKARRAQQTTSE